MGSATFHATFGASVGAFQPLFAAEGRAARFRPLIASEPPAVEEAFPQPDPAPQPDPEEEARARAERLLEEARQQAAEIILAAERNAELMVTQAVSQAREQEHASFQHASADLLALLESQTQAQLQQLELQTASLVSGIVRRILNQRFEDAPETIVPVARQALQELTESSHVQLVVAPQHGDALRQAYAELAAVLSDQARLEIVLSDDAEPFGCVVHGDHGSVDARLEGRLEAIEQVVQESIDEAKAA